MTLSLTLNEALKWLLSLPISMQESFWWSQCSERDIISRFPSLHTPPPIPVPNKPYGFRVNVKPPYLLTSHQLGPLPPSLPPVWVRVVFVVHMVKTPHTPTPLHFSSPPPPPPPSSHPSSIKLMDTQVHYCRVCSVGFESEPASQPLLRRSSAQCTGESELPPRGTAKSRTTLGLSTVSEFSCTDGGKPTAAAH